MHPNNLEVVRWYHRNNYEGASEEVKREGQAYYELLSQRDWLKHQKKLLAKSYQGACGEQRPLLRLLSTLLDKVSGLTSDLIRVSEFTLDFEIGNE